MPVTMSPLAAGVLLVLQFALGLADPLEDHLLGRLGGDAAEVGGGSDPTLRDGDVVLVELLPVDAELAGIEGRWSTMPAARPPGRRL